MSRGPQTSGRHGPERTRPGSRRGLAVTRLTRRPRDSPARYAHPYADGRGACVSARVYACWWCLKRRTARQTQRQRPGPATPRAPAVNKLMTGHAPRSTTQQSVVVSSCLVCSSVGCRRPVCPMSVPTPMSFGVTLCDLCDVYLTCPRLCDLSVS